MYAYIGSAAAFIRSDAAYWLDLLRLKLKSLALSLQAVQVLAINAQPLPEVVYRNCTKLNFKSNAIKFKSDQPVKTVTKTCHKKDLPPLL